MTWTLLTRTLRIAAGLALVVTGATSLCAQVATPSPTQSPTQAPPQSPPQSPASTIVIFDGSGSMWGKLAGEKQVKFDQARAAVREALAKLPPQGTHVGLVSFGHRRAADCTDVQVLVPPEAAETSNFIEHIMGPLDKLNPRGKGPLTAALREAAKALGKVPPPRQVVMIHDDPDNCQADPCAALADLQATAPGIVISVVGLGLKPEDALRYQCLTKPTGGRHVNAQDGAQLAAGIGEALKASAAAVNQVPVVRPPTTSAISQGSALAVEAIPGARAKPLDLVRTGPPALRLRALMIKDRIPLDHRVHWSILPSGASLSPSATPVAEADGIEAVVPVPAATYRVRATSGLVAAEADITVGREGQTLGELVFGAAELRLTTPLPGDAMLIVAERDDTAKPGSPPGRRVGVWPHGQTTLLIPARPLSLLLEQGQLRTQWPIAIDAGQSRQMDITQAGGRIEVLLQPPAGPVVVGGGPFADQPVVFTLEEDDPDSPRGRRELARSAAPTAEFVVPPGVYTISAARGPLETRERVAVTAGDTVRRALPLLASRLVIGARLAGASAAPSEGPSPDSFRITHLDTDLDVAMILPGPAVIADVPPGRYRIEARRTNAAIKAEQIVEVKAGEYRLVTMDYQAGELRIETVSGAQETRDLVSWRVTDAAGRLIWSGNNRQAASLLAIGRYTIRTLVGDERSEQVVDIRNGMISTVRFSLPNPPAPTAPTPQGAKK